MSALYGAYAIAAGVGLGWTLWRFQCSRWIDSIVDGGGYARPTSAAARFLRQPSTDEPTGENPGFFVRSNVLSPAEGDILIADLSQLVRDSGRPLRPNVKQRLESDTADWLSAVDRRKSPDRELFGTVRIASDRPSDLCDAGSPWQAGDGLDRRQLPLSLRRLVASVEAAWPEMGALRHVAITMAPDAPIMPTSAKPPPLFDGFEYILVPLHRWGVAALENTATIPDEAFKEADDFAKQARATLTSTTEIFNFLTSDASVIEPVGATSRDVVLSLYNGRETRLSFSPVMRSREPSLRDALLAPNRSWTQHDIDVVVPPLGALRVYGKARFNYAAWLRPGVSPQQSVMPTMLIELGFEGAQLGFKNRSRNRNRFVYPEKWLYGRLESAETLQKSPTAPGASTSVPALHDADEGPLRGLYRRACTLFGGTLVVDATGFPTKDSSLFAAVRWQIEDWLRDKSRQYRIWYCYNRSKISTS